MKLKNLSKILTFGILLNSVPINSFAGILSEDTRYETFKDSRFNVPNILEENKVDIKVDGRTLINHVDYKTINHNSGVSLDKTTKEITFNSSISNDRSLQFNADLNPESTYTIMFEIIENTLTENELICYLDSNEYYAPIKHGVVSGGETTIGVIKDTFTVKKDNSGI